MSDKDDITEKRVWTTKQLLMIVAFAISVTFTLTMIYSEFRTMQKEIVMNEERSTKQHNRQQIEIDNLKNNHPLNK